MPTKTSTTKTSPTCPARAELAAALKAQASRTALQMIKYRARAYAKRPRDLDALAPGLSAAAPETLIAAGAHLLRAEAAAPRRWFGFGAEPPALNARALMLLGRALRRLSA
ncbi:MAG: hypothetical protein ACLPSF_02910 [Methylocella sp.]